MATIKLKSEKRLKQVDTTAEGANSYESGDIVYDSDGNKFRTSNGTAWSDLTVPATVSDIGSITNVDAIGSNANRDKILKVKSGADEIEYSQVDEAIAGLYTITANGSSDYRFAGPGLAGSENDPTLYLVRGRRYQFYNNSGAHPFQFQTNANGTVGTGGQVYTTGITFASGSDIDNGETATWEVMFDAPAELYYQCTSHTAMGGPIKIVDGSGGGGSTTFASLTDTPANFSGAAGRFLKVNSGANAVEFVDENYVRSPMFVDEKTIANGASAHVNIESDLNAGDGGILTVKNDQAAASGSAPGTYGVSVNTANLTADPANVKYEILASDNKQFKFAAVTTAIASFSGQAQINAGSDVTVTDSQKLVLAYTGAAWKYSVQSR